MFDSFKLLWKHREKPITLNRWVIVWLKRIYHFKSLLIIILKHQHLLLQGATIGPLTILGKIEIDGPKKRLKIGKHASLGRCRLTLHESIKIGNFAVINDGVTLLTGSHDLQDPKWRHKSAPIVIDDYAWISQGATLLPGVHIGRGAVVGAGAVVRGEVPDYGIVIGNPSILVSTQRTQELSYSPILFNAPYEAWIGKNINNVINKG